VGAGANSVDTIPQKNLLACQQNVATGPQVIDTGDSTKMRIRAVLSILCLLAGSIGINLQGAETTGAVHGSVTDPSGAAIPAAEIELTNNATSVLYRAKTGSSGNYNFNAVPPGTYSIRAALEGFKTYTVTGVVVELNKSTQVNLRLDIGAVAESVEVSASATQIETAAPRIATNISEKLVIELPSANRNPLAVAELAPGVDLVRGASQVMNIEGATANVNGQRRSANVFYLDGSDNTGTFRNTALQFPNPDAVQEVQVTTASTSAEFGKQPGGIFNVITKSGTNDFHGTAFYFFRNKNLNANSWVRNQSGVERPDDNQKQAGGTIGGPILRNKTFFFTSFMAYRDKSPGFENTNQFPTEALLRGDFSQFNRPLYDPDTGAPLPGNQIPARLLDPVAKRLAELLPRASTFGQRFLYDYTDTVANQEWLGKIDHNFNSNHQASFSYLRTWGNAENFTNGSNDVPGWAPTTLDSQQDTISARYTWTMSPTMLLQGRFALARHLSDRDNAVQGSTLADFGALWPDASTRANKYLPILNISDGFVATQGPFSLFDQENTRFAATLSWVRGTHNLRFGAESQRSAVQQVNLSDRTQFNFDGRSSSTPEGGRPTGVGVFGYAMADFLMGRSSSFQQRGIRDYNIYNWSHYFFVQDEWRITRRLTLSPGLRYEFYQPSREVNGRTSAFVLGHKSDQYPNAPVNMAFQGDSGIPTGFFRQDRNNFAPRLGLAWDVNGDGKTAIRAGLGIYYSFAAMNIPMWNAERTPWEPEASGGETTSLVDPWRTSRTIRYPAPPAPFSDNPNDFNYPSRIVSLLGYDGGWRTPYTTQWSLSIERQLVKGVSVQAAYVGNRGIGFFQVLDGNLPLWAPNATLQNVEARRPIAGYGLVEILHARSRSWYDSLQLTADVRRVAGLTARFTYVYGKNLAIEAEDRGQGGNRPANPLNLDGEKAEFGRRQTARVFFVYDLPVFRDASGWLQRLAGGWQTSGAFSAGSGSRLDIQIGEDWNFDGQPGDRPDVLRPIEYTSGSRADRMAQFFDISGFANPGVRNTFGSLGRNALVGPGFWGADAALLKNFRFTEQRYFQFRAEAYNLFNHPNMDNPNTNMRSRDFGRILNLSGNRTMQIGLRFVF
jgi:hypothetical protein